MAFRTQLFAMMVISGLAVACGKSQEESPGGTSGTQQASEHAEHPSPSSQPAAAAPTGPLPAPDGARVFFVEPKDGAEIKGPLVDGKVDVKVKMGTEGIAVEPAGEQKMGTGHHHIIIDGDHVAAGTIVPKDDTHLHFGKGQTEADVMLPPGEHKLTMQFADGAHYSYGPMLASTITIKVVGEPAQGADKAAEPKPGK